ncbi:MAG: AEC family transporter [Candidatus Omnitrophota bacterium]|nr:AEC family transporter [Candidatus Omnitrophota bacterium]
MIGRLGLGLGLFLGSLALGWWWHRNGWLPEERASRLVRWMTVGASPVVLCLSFWQMNLRSLEPWLLPLLGMVIAFSTLLPAAIYARRARLSRPERGSFLTCAFFSNIGYLGAFTAFALFGEAGYALCMLYLVFFTPCFYTWGFWVGARYGRGGTTSALGAAYDDRLRLYPFVGMLAGAALNLAGLPRPLALEWLNHALIPVTTAFYLMAIGSQITFSSPRPWLRSCVVMSGIKFIYTPLVAWALVELLDLHGLPRTVVLLEASTPVAVSPLVLPLLFGLDRRLSNALWLFTTLLAIPWLLFLVTVVHRL